MFYKTQRELGEVLNRVVDSYWSDQIDENTLIKTIKYLYENNSSKMVKDGTFTTVLKQQCGKRRLEVINKILNVEEDYWYGWNIYKIQLWFRFNKEK